MHTHDLSLWTHRHDFHEADAVAERKTRWVMWITAAAMVMEIAAGWWLNSMALLADGWHMSSHALAIGLSVFAYASSRRLAADLRFAFGTWKIEVLAGYTSAVLLVGIAALMVFGSIERLNAPKPIQYGEALVVAVIGLAVNIVCAWLLAAGTGQSHGHTHDHSHAHGAHPEDLNLRSAYTHVVADAATSVLAIAALAGGWLYGWSWLDPVMGIVGAVLVMVWARNLLRQTSSVLLDREMDHAVVEEIRDVVEAADGEAHTRLSDLHVWRVGREKYACALSLVTHDVTLTPGRIRDALSVHQEIVHATVEINHCS